MRQQPLRNVEVVLEEVSLRNSWLLPEHLFDICPPTPPGTEGELHIVGLARDSEGAGSCRRGAGTGAPAERGVPIASGARRLRRLAARSVARRHISGGRALGAGEG